MLTKDVTLPGDHGHAGRNTAPCLFDCSEVISNIGVSQERQNTSRTAHHTDGWGKPRDVFRGDTRALPNDKLQAVVCASSRGHHREGIFLAAHQMSVCKRAECPSNRRFETLLNTQRVGNTSGHTGKGSHVSALCIASQSKLECRHRSGQSFTLTLGGVEGIAGLCFFLLSSSQDSFRFRESLLERFGHSIGGLILGCLDFSKGFLSVAGAVSGTPQRGLLALNIGCGRVDPGAVNLDL